MARKSLEGKFELQPFGTNQTKRLTIPAAEEILYKPFPCLDHGFVRLVDYMGGDSAVVQAARVSYAGGTKHTSEDTGLIRYLRRHRHTTPFEMVELKFHAKMPIFVARQWIRHRTANVNEQSGRYSILDNEFYIPEPAVLGVQAQNNKQGRDEPVTPEQAAEIIALLKEDANMAYSRYEELLNEDSIEAAKGKRAPRNPDKPMLARELARMVLSLNSYTQWYWKIDLHNLFHFLGLRKDKHAQYEIRVFADAMGEIAARVAPEAYQAFSDYGLNGIHLSSLDKKVIASVFKGEDVKVAAERLIPNKREREESIQKINDVLKNK